MKFQSARLGEISIEEKQLLTFPKGIPSFEEYTRYALIPAEQDEKNPFFFLQSLEEATLSFILLDPFLFFPDYEIQVSDAVLEELAITSREDLLVFTLVTIQNNLQEATTNLRGPIIVNVSKQIAKQTLLDDPRYQIKQPLFASEKVASEPAASGEKG